MLTLSYTLLSVQTMIPPPQTKKTFPGCVRSFSGYPLEGEADVSAITYIACIANKIKSAVKPWNSIRRSREEGIIKKMKKKLDKIITKKAITQRMVTAQKYAEVNDMISFLFHDISKWNTFLPPQNFTAEKPSFIGEGLTNLYKQLCSGKYTVCGRWYAKVFIFFSGLSENSRY